METGERITLEIAGLTEKGYGVARTGGMVVFVKDAVPGDRVSAVIREVRKKYATAETDELLERSTCREDPVCPDCSRCGACVLSHVSFGLENRTKAEAVGNAFRKAGVKAAVPDTAFSLDRTGYRNKLTVHYSQKLGAFGLYSEKSREVFPFGRCRLCPDILSECVRYINGVPELYRDSGPESLVLQITVSGEVYITLESEEKADSLLGDRIRKEFPAVKEVILRSHGRGRPSHFKDSLLDLEFTYPTSGFRQVNTAVFEKLLLRSAELLGDPGNGCIVDLYCGSGTVGISLARLLGAEDLIGIEINEDSVSLAKSNADRNGITSSRFCCGDASLVSRVLSENGIRDFTLTVDPPRAGLSEKARKEILSCKPGRLLYISCNPFTLSRDAAFFTGNGYMIDTAEVFNMFPMTEHVEVVCQLVHT